MSDAVPVVRHRRMTEDDLPLVAEVEASAYVFPWSVGVFRDCLRAGYVCRVLTAATGLGGYGIMSLGAGEAHILNVCVRADLRGQHLGRRLMTWLLDEAQISGQGWAFLEVRPSNRPALRLYQSLGFTQVGLRKAYYQAVGGREDALVQRLDLEDWARARKAASAAGAPFS